MGRLLTPRQIDALEHDGYVAPIRLFSQAEARHYRDRLEAYEAEMKAR